MGLMLFSLSSLVCVLLLMSEGTDERLHVAVVDTDAERQCSLCSYSPEVKHNQRLLPHLWGSDEVDDRVFSFHLFWFLLPFTELEKEPGHESDL